MPEKVHTVFADSDDESARQTSKPVADPTPVEDTGRKKKRSKKRKRDETAEQPARDTGDNNSIQAKEAVKSPAPPAEKLEQRYEPQNDTQQPSPVSQAPKSKPKPKAKAPIDHKTNFSSLREKANTLYELRKKLPIFGHADEIRNKLREQDVMLLVGETGSGKSTQIPSSSSTNSGADRPRPKSHRKMGHRNPKQSAGASRSPSRDEWLRFHWRVVSLRKWARRWDRPRQLARLATRSVLIHLCRPVPGSSS